MDIKISSFQGLQQYGDDFNRDPRNAVLAKNVYTQGGVLRPFAANVPGLSYTSPIGIERFVVLPAKIQTLAVLHRRWDVEANAYSVVLYAIAGGISYRTSWVDTEELPRQWIQTLLPGEDPTPLGTEPFSWLNYEIAVEGVTNPVDVIILSNSDYGMHYFGTYDDGSTHYLQTGVTTPKDFGVIARFNERVWGGAIPTDPDMLVYSAPYDFTDWTQNSDIPEDGAGDIQQPSWDGDSFTALVQFGNYLIAFKNHSIWLVSGTDPGVFVWSQQYGGGTLYHRTVAVDGERIIMLGDTGLLKYDGLAVQPFFPEQTEEFIKTINWDYANLSCACMWRDKYYLAVPTGTATDNNAVLIYNTRENTWMIRDDADVGCWLPVDDKLFYSDTSTTACGLHLWKEDSWEEGTAIADTQWVTPWFDTGDKSSIKGPWTVYFTLEAKASGSINVSIETEKGKKTKTYSFPDNEGSARQKQIMFGGSGRRFRLHFESNSAVPWRIIGGVEIATEIDED